MISESQLVKNGHFGTPADAACNPEVFIFDELGAGGPGSTRCSKTADGKGNQHGSVQTTE